MTSKAKQSAALIAAFFAWYGVVIFADVLLTVQAQAAPYIRYPVLGLVQFFIGGAIVLAAIRAMGLDRTKLGFTTDNLAPDLFVGFMTAIIFALLQFLVIIPATGGGERSDVVANAAQIGVEPVNLAGFLLLAIFGSTGEELLFRGLLLGGIAGILKGGMPAKILATVLVVVIFALSHGYQGWAGVIDTGLYGGLTLSLLYWWRGGRLAAPIAAHVGWNAIAVVAIFILYPAAAP